MNGLQLERVLTLIDSNISMNMGKVRGEILQYLFQHADDLAREITEKGYGYIPTHLGKVKVSREDLEAVHL